MKLETLGDIVHCVCLYWNCTLSTMILCFYCSSDTFSPMFQTCGHKSKQGSAIETAVNNSAARTMIIPARGFPHTAVTKYYPNKIYNANMLLVCNALGSEAVRNSRDYLMSS